MRIVLGLLGVVLDDQALDVQDQVGDVLDHAGDRRELVLDALDLDLGDGAPFEAGEQDAPQAVADGVAEAAFERLDVEFAEGVGQRVADADDPAGQFQATPTDTHRVDSLGQAFRAAVPRKRWGRVGRRCDEGCPTEMTISGSATRRSAAG